MSYTCLIQFHLWFMRAECGQRALNDSSRLDWIELIACAAGRKRKIDLKIHKVIVLAVSDWWWRSQSVANTMNWLSIGQTFNAPTTDNQRSLKFWTSISFAVIAFALMLSWRRAAIEILFMKAVYVAHVTLIACLSAYTSIHPADHLSGPQSHMHACNVTQQKIFVIYRLNYLCLASHIHESYSYIHRDVQHARTIRSVVHFIID